MAGAYQKWAEFLEQTPPGQRRFVNDALEPYERGGNWFVATPTLRLHCNNEACGDGPGDRTFESVTDSRRFIRDGYVEAFLKYQCRNCEATGKTFAVRVVQTGETSAAEATKFGEIPAFGPPTPPRLLRLLGDDKDLFLAGRRAENRGLGIGAYAYYRRIVENQRNRLFAEIRKVAERTNASPPVLRSIDEAIADNQFFRSLERMKEALPPSLLVDAHHNPLAILHSALSEDLHAASDDTCMEAAQTVRLALAALTERMAAVLKDETEVLSAFSKLMNKRQAKEKAQE